MKKSNKLTFVYIASSLVLFFALLGGGVYGVYVMVGRMFVRSNIQDVVPMGAAQNVAYGGESVYQAGDSPVGLIIVSVVLIVLAVFDFVSLVKQIVFFKQFKPVKDSVVEKSVEKKIKSKKSVVVFACVIDVLSIIAGAVGLFLNARGYAFGMSWIFYLIDGIVCVFALMSIIFLLIKLNRVKQFHKANTEIMQAEKRKSFAVDLDMDIVDRIEYFLLKLKHLKSSRMISGDEYESLRKNLFCSEMCVDDENEKQKNKED